MNKKLKKVLKDIEKAYVLHEQQKMIFNQALEKILADLKEIENEKGDK